MITAVIGKPGDGKSLHCVRMICADLRARRVVATNIPLLRGPLREHLAKTGDPECPLDELLVSIPEENVPTYWRYRASGLRLDQDPDQLAGDDDRKRLGKQEWTAWMLAQFRRLGDKYRPGFGRPVCYYLDEAHEHFSARQWGATGRGALYHASKHRHLGDEIVIITQALDHVDKQLRNLVSETVVCRNNVRRSVGWFKLRPKMTLRRYYGVPSPTAKPYATEQYDLDIKGVASCYRTAGALGPGRGPEEVRNRGRLPWWALWATGVALIAVVTAALFAAPSLGAKLGKAAFTRGTKVQRDAIASARAADKSPQGGSPLGSPSAADAQAGPVVVGVMVDHGGVWVAVRGAGWVRAIAQTGDIVRLADGTVVPATCLQAGRTW